MVRERIVFAAAGGCVLLGLLLAQLFNPQWLWFSAFVGVNLFQSAFTKFCPLDFVLKSCGVKGAADMPKMSNSSK